MKSGVAWAMRTALLGAVVVGATLLALGLQGTALGTSRYLYANQVAFSYRLGLVMRVVLGAGATGILLFGATLLFERRYPGVPLLLSRLVRACSPIAPLSAVPFLMRWAFWKEHDLIFLTLALAVALAFKFSLAAACDARPLELFGLEDGQIRPWGDRFASIRPRTWTTVVMAAVVAYVLYFSYYTVVWHLCCRSGWDLAIEDNVLWNLLHGGPFFKGTPETGPTGSHFSRHAALVAYLFVPFYAFHQSADTLLVIQSVLVGTAAIPLYLFAKNRIGAPLAALVAVLYLMHPALQEGNLFEMHYTKVATLPFWMTIWLLDTRRHRWALVTAALTVLVREDIATWIVLLGAFGLAAGLRIRTCLLLLLVGACYVGVIKFWAMPAFSGGDEELLFMYKTLLPAGKNSFVWAILSAFTNPTFLLMHVLTEEKLIFVLQIFVPMLFLPLWRRVGWVAVLPGFVFCLMSTDNHALVDIHFQYATHLLSPLYPALVLALGAELKETRPRSLVIGTVGAFALATFLCSSQYGSVIQQNTSRGGPMTYKFDWDDEGRERYQAINKIKKFLPEDAVVAASAFTLTQVSARPDAYPLSLGLWNAEYVLSATISSEILRDERERMVPLLRDGTYGVVAISHPFFLMRRGHSTELNAEILRRIR